MSIDKSDIKTVDKSPDDEENTSLAETKNFMQKRSHSLQSSSTVVHHQQHSVSHQSSTTTMSSEKTSSYHKSTSSSTVTSSTTGTKAKFQSFLQHPEPSVGSAFLSVGRETSQQKFHRQFVRSASAHSTEGHQAAIAAAGSTTKTIKTLRSASQQMEDDQSDQHLKIQQASSVLISKSAENLETKVQFGQANRSQLTLSGGFLAPPNRKLTILSPVHSAPGLHEYLLKNKGRSPISPKIQFPGADYDPFM